MRQWTTDVLDYEAAALAGLMLAIHAAGLWLAATATVPAIELGGSGQATDPAIVPGAVALVVVESLVIVAVWGLVKRLPAWVRRCLTYAAGVALSLVVGWVAYSAAGLVAVGMFAALLLTLRVCNLVGLFWLPRNLAGVGLGIVGVAVLGRSLSPAIVILLLVLFLAWDVFAVDLTDIMGSLVEFSQSADIPNFIVVPSGLFIDESALDEFMSDPVEEPRPENVATIIGLGDFVVPGILPAALATTTAGVPLAAIGAVVGAAVSMVVLQRSMEHREGGAPALLWTNTGAIGGFAVGALLGSTPLAELLGVAVDLPSVTIALGF